MTFDMCRIKRWFGEEEICDIIRTLAQVLKSTKSRPTVFNHLSYTSRETQ